MIDQIASKGQSANSQEEEPDVKQLLQGLKRDSEFTFRRLHEIAQTPAISQNSRLQKQFERLLQDLNGGIHRLDKQLKNLDRGIDDVTTVVVPSGASRKAKRRRTKWEL